MFNIIFLKNFAHLNNYPRNRIDYESVIDDYFEIHLTNSLYIFKIVYCWYLYVHKI